MLEVKSPPKDSKEAFERWPLLWEYFREKNFLGATVSGNYQNWRITVFFGDKEKVNLIYDYIDCVHLNIFLSNLKPVLV